MKRSLRSGWFWLGLFLVLVLSGLVFLGHNTGKVMYPALDALASVPYGQRWSHPEIVKIRALGPKAINPLRSVLRERDRPSTRFLLWVKAKWPAATKYYSHFPDLQKMAERRHTACQVFQTLGPAARPAAPDVIRLFWKGDISDSNSACSALWAMGIDTDICEQLAAVLEEKGVPESSRLQMVSMLAKVKPPSERTLRAVANALDDPSPWVQSRAAETADQLRVSTPAIVSSLKRSQTGSTNELVVVKTSVALWDLEKDAEATLDPVLQVLNRALARPMDRPFGGGSGGQGITADEQMFMAASELFPRMNLAESDRAKALEIQEAWCEKSGRIFVRMLLLPGMMELGFPREKCLEVCQTGLNQEEVYYRLQAAQLLIKVSVKYGVSDEYLNTLIHDRDVGVRVYAARTHWQIKKQPAVVVPVLAEALNDGKHHSYYYDLQILPAALELLKELGPEAAPAAAELTALTHDPNPVISKLAMETLTGIRK